MAIRWFRREIGNTVTELHTFTDPTQPWLDCGEKHVDRRWAGAYTITTEFSQFVDDALSPELHLWVNIVSGPDWGLFRDSITYYATCADAIADRGVMVNMHNDYAALDSLFRQNAMAIRLVQDTHRKIMAGVHRLVKP